MRTLMWFTMGFAVSCGIGAYGLINGFSPLFAAAALMAAALIWCAGRKMRVCRIGAVVLLGCVMGVCWFGFFSARNLAPVKPLDGSEQSICVTASDYSYETAYGTAVDGTVTLEGKSCQIRLYLRETVDIKPGDTITGCFRLRLTVPDGEDPSSYFQGKGIFMLGYQKGEFAITLAGEIPLRYRPAWLRRQIGLLLDAALPGDVAAFGRALLLGDTRNLDYGLNTAFKVSGIRHIVAVSGLHISILFSLVSMITFRRRYLSAFLGIFVLGVFAAVAGFTASVNRACIMVLLMLLAGLMEREYDPPTALSFAVLVMLIVNPLVVTSVSLQLSVLCVAGILLLQKPVFAWLQKLLPEGKGLWKRLWTGIAAGASVTLSSMCLVTPLTAWYFGSVSLISPVTNLLTLWVVTFVFNGLVLLCIAGAVFPAAAAVLGTLLGWPMRFVLWIDRTLASFPLTAVYTVSVYIVAWLVFIYVLLAVFLIQKEKQPVQLICLGCIGLCAALLASWAEPRMDESRFTVLDVGQGQSILLQSEGRTYLVDCGGENPTETADLIAETLLSQGINILDGIILTHYDDDHAGALENLLCRVDAKLLILPDIYNEKMPLDIDGSVVYVWEDLRLTYGNTSMTVYGPIYSGSDNENSLCVLFDTKKCDILITGDRSEFGERMLLRNRNLPDVDVLVAGHHGAADSTSVQLLAAVTPETVVISTGENNIYDHPAPALLQRLADFGCRVFRTDRDGTIVIRR